MGMPEVFDSPEIVSDPFAGTQTSVHGEHRKLLEKSGSLLCPIAVPKRYVVGIMAFFGMCNMFALRVNLSVAIIAMARNRTHYAGINNSRIVYPDFDWDSGTQGVILGSFFYGYIITQIPAGYLATRVGGTHLFGGGIFLAGLLTLLTPMCAYWSVHMLMGVLALQGLFLGSTYPSLHAILSKWAPPLERSRLATLVFSGAINQLTPDLRDFVGLSPKGVYVGTFLSLTGSAALAESNWGWPSIFYVFGSITVVWYILWLYLITENPGTHPNITLQELEYIQASFGLTEKQSKYTRPSWRNILTCTPVWAIVIAHFSENWGVFTWLTELPTFLNDVFQFNMYQVGLLAAMPYLILAIVLQGSGHLADYLRSEIKVSTLAVRKSFTCGAFLVKAVAIGIAGYTLTRTTCLVCLTISVTMGGFAETGYLDNHLDIAPQYASILMGLSNMVATLPGMISPVLTGVIVHKQDNPEDWHAVFYIATAVYIVGSLAYGVMASGERQDWANI